LLLFGALAVFTASVLPSHRFWRIPVLWSMTLCPFTAKFLVVALGRLLPRSVPRAAVSLAFGAVLLGASFRFVRAQGSGSFDRKTLRMSHEVAERFTAHEFTEEGKVLILAGRGAAGHLRGGAGDPTRYVMTQRKNERYFRGRDLDWERLSNEHIEAVITDKALSKRVNHSKRLELVVTHGPWTLHRVRREADGS
jgi:hypothetical protein